MLKSQLKNNIVQDVRGDTVMKKFGFIIACLVYLIPTAYAGDGVLKTSPLAVIFGSQPDLRSLRMSPDGSKMVFIQYHPDGYDFVRILDFDSKKMSGMIFAGTRDGDEIDWCRWANDERVLCSLSKMNTMNGNYYRVSRLVGVNYDGKDIKLLVPKELKNQFSTGLATVIDWLPDDPNHVQIPVSQMGESSVGSLDIYTGNLSNRNRGERGAYRWISDGHGVPRLYQFFNRDFRRWYLRDPNDERKWDVLHEVKADDFTDHFEPYGFADNPDELLFFDTNHGRQALFSMDLAHNQEKKLVFAHDRLDVLGIQTLGKYNRSVAAIYFDDKVRHYFFDKDIEHIYELLTPLFPDQNVEIIDEDWNRRYYTVVVTSDIEPGVYYRYDNKEHKVARIASRSSKFKNQRLAVMKEITYPARDKVEIPAFLTLPVGEKKTGLPVVILPHGGPSSRDVWNFDVLAQFLAANGFVVMQSNYRGSEGYGDAWRGTGAFRNWKSAINDVNDGTKYLIDQGIADPGKICAVGWSYGGYAALMSAIEEPALYKCIVSIAGVTDPRTLGWRMLNYVGGDSALEFIGAEDVGDTGSPLKRTDEIKPPVLLVHAKEDVNVPFKQSEQMNDALGKSSKSVEFIQYEHADHGIRPERYRIDLFTRIAEFLNKYAK